MKNKVLNFLNEKIKELNDINIAEEQTSFDAGLLVDFLDELGNGVNGIYEDMYQVYEMLLEDEGENDEYEDTSTGRSCTTCLCNMDGWCNALSDTVNGFGGGCSCHV